MVAAMLRVWEMRAGWVALAGCLFGLLGLASESAAFRTPQPLGLRAAPSHRSMAHGAPSAARLGRAAPRRSLLRMLAGDNGGSAAGRSGPGEPSAVVGGENLPYYSPDSKAYPLDYFGESTRGDLLPNEDMMGPDTLYSRADIKNVCDQLGLDKWGTPKTWGLPAKILKSAAQRFSKFRVAHQIQSLFFDF